jgi:transposase
MKDITPITSKLNQLWPHLDERTRRLVAAAEAAQLGHGGVTAISKATGLSRVTIHHGIKEIGEKQLAAERVRRVGAGRQKLEKSTPEIIKKLEALVEPLTRGDPESPLRWSCKSTRTLAKELTEQKFKVSHEKVCQLLKGMNYSLQGNNKIIEGASHPDRNAQFLHINGEVEKCIKDGCPVISVDTKKKEMIGNFVNKGKEWRESKTTEPVNGHDFPDPQIPRAYPYGIFDLIANSGFVNIGTDHDTSTFAVASIRGWWESEGKKLYPNSKTLMITADCGGSNGYRLRLWKYEIQKLADETGMTISMCHFPPGTSKWNKVEHRLFSFITSNWRGQPLRDYETIVNLIAATTTSKGLKVQCRLDRTKYPLGKKVSKHEMNTINIVRKDFHGEWNYEIKPRGDAKV